MKNCMKIVFFLTLSAFASTVANAAYLENAREIQTRPAPAHSMNKSVVHRGLDSMAYVPAPAAESYPQDFGIGSQR
jgi:hypothetical protein